MLRASFFWASLRFNRFDSHPVLLCGRGFNTGMLIHGLLIEREPAKARPPENAGYVLPKPRTDEEDPNSIEPQCTIYFVQSGRICNQVESC
jgi:hypothetical protein